MDELDHLISIATAARLHADAAGRARHAAQTVEEQADKAWRDAQAAVSAYSRDRLAEALVAAGTGDEFTRSRVA